MAQKSRRNGGMSSFARKHVGDMVPQPDNVSAATLTSMDRLTILMEKAMREILVVTYWFDPVPHSGSYPVTVRFSGRRTDVKGRLSSGDRFVQDEIIKEVFPGSGPISLTARIYNINPGTWVVAAHQLQSISSIRASKEQGKVAPVVGSLPPIVRLWYR